MCPCWLALWFPAQAADTNNHAVTVESEAPGLLTNSLGIASVDNVGQTDHYFRVGETNFVCNHYTKEGWTNAPLTTLAGVHEYIFLDGRHDGLDSEWQAVGDDLKGRIAICFCGTIALLPPRFPTRAGGYGLGDCRESVPELRGWHQSG